MHTWFSLIRFRSPLLTESLLFSLPVGTEMFHFPAFPPHALYIQARVTPHHSCWVSPFGNPRISARLTAPRGLSQPPTSFIGSWCQGIHRTLLDTYFNKDARSTDAIPKTTHQPPHPERHDRPASFREVRCSRPLSSSQTTHKTIVNPCLRGDTRVLLSGPNSVSIVISPTGTRPAVRE